MPTPASSRLVFPQPDAWTSAVGIDELDACFFEGAAYRSVIWCGQGSLVFTKLSAPDGRDPHLRLASQVFRAPAKEGARSSQLTAREGLHVLTLNDM
jgi:hypothetical protein